MRIRQVLLLIALLGFMASCSQQSPADTGSSSNEAHGEVAEGDDGPLAVPGEGDWHTYYTGSLDGKIEIVLDLHGQGNSIRGAITYKKTGKPITVLGNLRNEDLWLKELQPDGLVTGTISAKLDGDRLSGNWYGGKDDEYKLEMTASRPPEGGQEWPYEAPSTVAGQYEYHYPDAETGDPGAQGVLTVKQQGDMVTFSFDCVSSPPAYNMATIEEAEAPLQGNQVSYHETEYGDCEFVIKFFKGFALVEYVNDHYDCGFGMAATVEGEYIKVK